MEKPVGRITPSSEVKNLLTVNSCWFVKLPGGNAVSKMWVKELTATTVKLAGEFGLKTRYWLPDLVFLEPVSIEPPKLNEIYHEIKWSKP